MSTKGLPRWLSVITDTSPAYIARDGIVYGRDSAYPDDDPRHLWAAASCVSMHDNAEAAQVSAEDLAFMLSGYTEALALLASVLHQGLTPDLRRLAKILLERDEAHGFRGALPPLLQ